MPNLSKTEKAFLMLQNICVSCRERPIDLTDSYHQSPSSFTGMCMSCALKKATEMFSFETY